MRLYNIASGTLLLLPIINFALAAPVPENSGAGVDVVQIPRDVINALGKRVGEEDIVKMGAEIFDSSGKSAESSSAHASGSSSSAQPETGHMPTNDAQPGPPPPPPHPNPEHGPPNPGSTSTAPAPDSFDQRINKAWVAHNAAFSKDPTPAAAHLPAPATGSFDDRITAAWDKHYDTFQKGGTDTAHPLPQSSGSSAATDAGHEPSSPVAGSFDDKMNKAWGDRYNTFLQKGAQDTNF